MMSLWRFLLLFLLATGSAFAFSGTPVAVDTIKVTELPEGARVTLALIKQGGPYPYDRDGVIFGNYEKRLPRAQRGFYREYTVKTPGQRTRGARRIVAGGDPPAVFYYTDDHYQSFRRIQESP